MPAKPIAIYGAGGLGKEVLALINALPEWDPIGFYDDQKSESSLIKGLPVLGNFEKLKTVAKENIHLVIAIGNPTVKKELVSRLKDIRGMQYPVLVHPSAVLMERAAIELGEGSIIGAGCIMTTDILIGKHVLVNINSTIGHDCSVGDFTSIMPGVNLAGEVKVGSEVLIGSGANIRNGLILGDQCKIGMGAVVLQNINEGVTAVGVPAKMIKS